MNRREFIRRTVVSTVLVATGVVGIAELATVMQKQGQQQVSTFQQITTQQPVTTQQGGSSTTAATPAGYTFVTALNALANKTYAYFTHPTYGNAILVSVGGAWKAFGATCTHRPCTVQYQNSSTIYCPCHGGTFDTGNGSVTGGPPPSPLPEFGVAIQSGNLYVSNSRIN